MPDISAIYIIDNEDNPFYIKETFSQGTEDSAHALLSSFISAFQHFATELGSAQAKVVKLGNNKIIAAQDNLTKFQFVLKVDLNAKEKKMLGIIDKIKNLFIGIFTGNLLTDGTKKQELLSKFEVELDELLRKKDKIESFLQKL